MAIVFSRPCRAHLRELLFLLRPFGTGLLYYSLLLCMYAHIRCYVTWPQRAWLPKLPVLRGAMGMVYETLRSSRPHVPMYGILPGISYLAPPTYTRIWRTCWNCLPCPYLRRCLRYSSFPRPLMPIYGIM